MSSTPTPLSPFPSLDPPPKAKPSPRPRLLRSSSPPHLRSVPIPHPYIHEAKPHVVTSAIRIHGGRKRVGGIRGNEDPVGVGVSTAAAMPPSIYLCRTEMGRRASERARKQQFLPLHKPCRHSWPPLNDRQSFSLPPPFQMAPQPLQVKRPPYNYLH